MQALGLYNEESNSESGSPHRSSGSRNGKGKEKSIPDDGKLSGNSHHTTGGSLPKIRPPSTLLSVKNAVGSGSVQIIRRPVQVQPRDRTRSPSFTEAGPSSAPKTSQPSVPREQLNQSQEPQDELTRIRSQLLPPPILGIDDWGISPSSTELCDPELEAKLSKFFELKRGDPPKHFNDSLMANRSFRNPHLYAKLVEFVDVDEQCSNIPKGVWDMDDLDGWDAEKIAVVQKERSDEQAAAQAPGKRSKIAFTSSSTSGARSSSNVPSQDSKEHRDGRKFNPYDSKGRGDHRHSRR